MKELKGEFPRTVFTKLDVGVDNYGVLGVYEPRME